jgi:hypothetical protein
VPVHRLLLLPEDLLEELASSVVALLARQRDALVETVDGLQLELQIDTVLLDRILTHAYRVHPLHVRRAVEEEDSLDHAIRVLHLLDRLLALLRGEHLVAPVRAHAVVDEVLVDGRQLGGQDVVQRLDDLGVSPHGSLLMIRFVGFEAILSRAGALSRRTGTGSRADRDEAGKIASALARVPVARSGGLAGGRGLAALGARAMGGLDVNQLGDRVRAAPAAGPGAAGLADLFGAEGAVAHCAANRAIGDSVAMTDQHRSSSARLYPLPPVRGAAPPPSDIRIMDEPN